MHIQVVSIRLTFAGLIPASWNRDKNIRNCGSGMRVVDEIRARKLENSSLRISQPNWKKNLTQFARKYAAAYSSRTKSRIISYNIIRWKLKLQNLKYSSFFFSRNREIIRGETIGRRKGRERGETFDTARKVRPALLTNGVLANPNRLESVSRCRTGQQHYEGIRGAFHRLQSLPRAIYRGRGIAA